MFDTWRRPRIEPGLLFQRLVERDRIFMDLSDRVAEVEQRQETRRMPGRAGGQLLALDEDAVGPALPGEMIERRDADHAPANDHSPRVRSHSHPLDLRRLLIGRSLTSPLVLAYDASQINGGTPIMKRLASSRLSCLVIIGAAHADCLKGNSGIPPGANTTDPSAPFYIDTTGLDFRTSPPTRDPKNPNYPPATELPDGTLPQAAPKAISSSVRPTSRRRSLPPRTACRRARFTPSPCRRTTARSSTPA